MDELSPHARALLDRAQPEFSPSADEAARLRARLFDAPPPDDPDEGGDTETGEGTDASTVGGASGHFGLYLALAAVIVVWLAWPTGEPTPPPTDAAVPARTTAPPTATAPARIDTMPASAPRDDTPTPNVVDDDAAPPPALEPAPSRPTRPSPRTPPRAEPSPTSPDAIEPATPEPAPAPSDDLAAELALIGDARRALNAERWSKLRGLVAEHGRRFPKGVLRDEAEVLDLLARCATEPSDALRDEVRRRLDTPGPFAERLRRACLE